MTNKKHGVDVKYMLILLFPVLVSLIFFVFSYIWIDHGLVTFLAYSRPIVGNFYDVIKFASENRIILAKVYLFLVIILFIFQLVLFIPKIYNNIKINKFLIVAGIVTIFFTFSFPFLSRDIFTYYFSAKIELFYNANPYIIAPIDFMEKDVFVGLLHNIASPYLYGRGFLLYTMLLMVITSYNKVLTYFFLYKLLNGIFFFLSGLIIYRLVKDKRIFAIWFFNPYLLIEWLANSHNDTVMAFFFIVSVYFFHHKRWIRAGLFYLCSILIKFVSVLAIPAIFLKGDRRDIYFKFVGLLLPVAIHFQGRTVQPWYLLWSYMFLPFVNLKTLSWVLFSLIGLMFAINYYGFIESGGWGMGNLIPYSLEISFILILMIFINEYWHFINKKLSWVKHRLIQEK